MKQYLNLISEIIEENEQSIGSPRDDRTGTGTYSVFGRQMRFDLSQGFPLVTTKKCHLKSIIHELLWFLSGDTNIKSLNEQGVSIWDEWADPDGELGRVYGAQWRSWTSPSGEKIDQIAKALDTLKNNPHSRRNMILAWNPAEIPPMAPPACHSLFQLYVKEGKLSLQLYQRSADVMLGVPFNIASYALLLMMFAQCADLEAHEFIHTIGDAHIYANHLEGAKKQLERDTKSLPQMNINPDVKDIFSFKFEDFKLENYEAHPHIKFAIAV